MTQDVTISLAEVNSVARAALLRAGCDDANAAAVADVIARAERDGCASHGLFRLPGYLASLASGKVDGKAAPTVEQLAPGVTRIDGRGGFAPLAMQAAREAIAPLARTQGIAAAAVVNVHHFSALWADIEDLVERGLCAFLFTSYLPTVAPAGATKPFFGTNPMAFGWPGDDGFIFDAATAATARGELQIAARDGHLAPEGAGIDTDGVATRDPAKILAGAQLPFGGHKGSAIALMIELLAGVLLGQPTSPEAGREHAAVEGVSGPPRGGLLMIALEPRQFGDAGGWHSHAESFFAELRALPGVRLPGDRREIERKRIAREGVAVPAALWQEIQTAGAV